MESINKYSNEVIKNTISEDYYPYLQKGTQMQYYRELADNSKMKRNIENQFVCLKGFSSSTPLFRSFSFGETCVGGGFYFRWKGTGIVVDPGIGFLSLMLSHSIFVEDVDVVIVTHAHLDHNQDVRSISALLYDLNKQYERNSSFFAKFFPDRRSNSEHKISWYLDRKTQDELKDDIDTSYDLNDLIDKSEHFISDAVGIKVFSTKHCENSCGIKLFFRENGKCYTWGYTSDTAYFDNLLGELKDCDVLITNISEVNPRDIEGKDFKKNHLGINGTTKLISQVNPQIALISEFACVSGDNRNRIIYDISQKVNLKEKLKEKIWIMPTEIGMKVDIMGERICCSWCGSFCLRKDVIPLKPEFDFGKIRYICKECLLQGRTL